MSILCNTRTIEWTINKVKVKGQGQEVTAVYFTGDDLTLWREDKKVRAKVN